MKTRGYHQYHACTAGQRVPTVREFWLRFDFQRLENTTVCSDRRGHMTPNFPPYPFQHLSVLHLAWRSGSVVQE